MVVQKIRCYKDLEILNHYTKFGPETRRATKDAIEYLKDVEIRYGGLIDRNGMRGTIAFQLDRIRPLIKSDLEAYAKKAERTAEYEEKEGKKLKVIADGFLIASGLLFMATNFNPEIAIAGLLFSGIVYLEAFLCEGRALVKKDEARLLRESDIEAE
ncbi:MAG: hypothetical protein QXL47_03005 [Candidatus Anstonellales archaeon]